MEEIVGSRGRGGETIVVGKIPRDELIVEIVWSSPNSMYLAKCYRGDKLVEHRWLRDVGSVARVLKEWLE